MKNSTSTKKATAKAKTTARKSPKPAARKTAKAESAKQKERIVNRESLSWYLAPLKPVADKKKEKSRADLVYELQLHKLISRIRENAKDIDDERRETAADRELAEIKAELASARTQLAEIKELLTKPRSVTLLSSRNLTDKIKLPHFPIDYGKGSPKKGSGKTSR